MKFLSMMRPTMHVTMAAMVRKAHNDPHTRVAMDTGSTCIQPSGLPDLALMWLEN